MYLNICFQFLDNIKGIFILFFYSHIFFKKKKKVKTVDGHLNSKFYYNLLVFFFNYTKKIMIIIY